MKIVIVKLSAIGDIVHSLIVLEYIKLHYPDAKIDWVVESRFAKILKNHHHIDTLFELNLKEFFRNKEARKLTLSSLKKLRKNEYDIVFDLQGLLKSAILTKLLRAKKRVGFDKESIREPAASWFYTNSFRIAYEENIIKRNLFLIQKAFSLPAYEIENKPPLLRVKNEATYVDVLLVLGSSWKSKIYPKELLKEYIELLKEYSIWLCYGSQKEEKMAKELASSTHALLAPKVNLDKLKELISQSRVVVGPDSGPTHMAWAINKPSITIYGPTPFWRNSYETKINLTIDSKEEIDPKKLDKNSDCISKINPKDIANLTKRLLGG